MHKYPDYRGQREVIQKQGRSLKAQEFIVMWKNASVLAVLWQKQSSQSWN